MFYTELRSAVAKKHKLSEKQAYRRMEANRKNKEIVKVELPGRRTMYGLPKWPLPKSKKEELQLLGPYPHFFWETVSEIKNLLAQKENWEAWTKTLVLIETFPLKDKMKTDIDQAYSRIGHTQNFKGVVDYIALVEQNQYFNTVSRQEILYLLGKMSMLLHES